MRAGTPGFNGVRLREAREVRSLPVAVLAELLDVSQQSVYHYENGRTTPGPEVFERVVQTLHLPAGFFTRGDRPASSGRVFYRSMASATKSARGRAEHRLRWLTDITEWVSHYVELPEPDIPNLGLPSDPLQISDAEIEEAAAAVRAHWRMDDGPVADMVLLLEHHGVVVGRDLLGAESLDGLSEVTDRPYVLLGIDKGTAVRWRFDLAHELGHLILHRDVVPECLRKGPDFRKIEGQAHRFAGAFLLPLGPFVDEVFGAGLDAFRAIKPRWKVSIATMIHRAHDVGMIGEADARRLWINLGRRRWRTSEPYDDVMEAERPRLLRRAIEMVIEEGVFTAGDLLNSVALPAGDVEALVGLDRGYLADAAPLRLRTSGRRVTPDQSDETTGRVIPFVRPSG